MQSNQQQLKTSNQLKTNKPPIDIRSSRNNYEQSADKSPINKSFNDKNLFQKHMQFYKSCFTKDKILKNNYLKEPPVQNHNQTTHLQINHNDLFRLKFFTKCLLRLKIYQQINQRLDQQKQQQNCKNKDTQKYKTEESKSHKNESTSSTINDSDEQIQNLINLEEIVFTIMAVISRKRKSSINVKIILIEYLTSYWKKKIKLLNKYSLSKYIQREQASQLFYTKHYLTLLKKINRIQKPVILYSQQYDFTSSINQSIQYSLTISKSIDTSQIKQNINLIRKNCNVVYSLLVLFVENSTDDKLSSLEKPQQTQIESLYIRELNSLNRNIKNCIISYIIVQLSHIEQLRLTMDSQDFQFDYEEVIDCYQIPYLSKTNRYTLVIDLDETLVHYQELVDEGQFLVRPFAQQFLKDMSKFYEIVIFTAAQQDYADFILDLIDEDKSITHRLYRQHTTLVKNTYVKDIQKIGRDIKKTIIIDNLAENFQLQPDNGIQIQSWYGDLDDQALLLLSPLLIQIVQKKIPDVREALRKFRDQMQRNIEAGISDPHLHLSLE